MVTKRWRDNAARVGNTDQQRSRLQLQRLMYVRNDWSVTSKPREHGADVLTGEVRVDHGNDYIATVLHNAVSGLGMAMREKSVGENGVSAAVLPAHAVIYAGARACTPKPGVMGSRS